MNAQSPRTNSTSRSATCRYVGPAYEDAANCRRVEAARLRVIGSLRFVVAIAEWRQHQAVLQEMELMTDRELADIGLTRSDLPRVFDPAFAADRAARPRTTSPIEPAAGRRSPPCVVGGHQRRPGALAERGFQAQAAAPVCRQHAARLGPQQARQDRPCRPAPDAPPVPCAIRQSGRARMLANTRS